ncbi:hypothetical protein GALMADRAFT_208024 [Galerina marginata CBS 339.88]|uniref:F-box domain-containing protein n=1 Tax=Galerina marginata (strain CBS 339.88) TaxID=685588 RepID=A0A067TDG3_GALM3|nr:hypothetical protein GALMADRAFT_208024 [Galerina marginata CBS 339.88]
MHDNAAMLLPSELKHHIGTFCTPRSLASLAQVHTSYREEAERVLYKKIYLYIWKHSGEMRCLDTLSSNSEKAAFVHSLTVEFPSNWNKNRDESVRAVVALSSALCLMSALSDLRVRLPNGQLDDPSPERITDSLRHQHSQLRTLCCNDYLDIPAIVENQRQLQVLGIYSNGRFLPDLLKRLEAMPFSLPTVFAMERNSALPTFNHLEIFPALPTNNFKACEAIAEAIHVDVSRQMILETTRVVQMSIWLKDFSEITFIRDIAFCFNIPVEL